jgi:hypothetical protein
MLVGAGIFSFNERIIITGVIRNADGLGQEGYPVTVATQHDPPIVLGQLLRKVIETRLDRCESIDLTSQAVLDAAGARTWSELDKGSLYCSVEWTESTLSIMPSRTERRGGHSFDPTRAIVVGRQISDSALGEAILNALGRCI